MSKRVEAVKELIQSSASESKPTDLCVEFGVFNGILLFCRPNGSEITLLLTTTKIHTQTTHIQINEMRE